ncbi:ABC transporter ATP-binding protein [Maridesulfovibrio hydrothermalis]|uniref:Leucine/isoleucine/valine transporter subunit ATP-binding component of ABC superfamily n=1 Tax=Maridesulfovibrio hydrothermalis AM13 = DSM 14728 TaxID=1121451 RepID=L0R5X9_9BACT|nr:ABC transporter ATP-binding protein [Maridesulfovibrio hydrothermalis]CCO22093.1 leucine/isoleucine/valine transporter subunit; ATP-binding component of ABC superfamily [Maridesulfovibrio hydrothermalis AM13 = DSM 14728]
MSNERRTVLEVKGVCKDFGGLRALDDVDLDVKEGEIVALIGPNGAGKTTFFNCITGIYSPTFGDVNIDPLGGGFQRINGLKTNKITELGMARTFQNIRLFPSMSVIENVMIGCHCRTKATFLGAIFRDPRTKREERETILKSYELLKELGLDQFSDELACNLPYGAQRRLEIARALATDPFLLLLDEPAAGMNPQETLELEDLIVAIKEKHNISVLLIEHDMKMVMSLSDRLFVLEYGREIAHGTPQEVSENPAVIKAYLGEDLDA